MPYLKLTTNQPLPAATREELKAAFGEAAALLGKSESWLMVDFCPESPLYFKGTAQPAALVSVDLFGAAGQDAYDAFTARATAIVAEATAVPADRIFVKYSEYTHWGWNGSNF